MIIPSFARTQATTIRFGCILAAGVALVTATTATAQQTMTAVNTSQPDREKEFARQLKNVDLIGSFRMTRDLKNKQPLGDPIPEKYGITEAVKDDGDWWIVTARIQYMNNDVQLPVRVRVIWADDTPIITVDDVMIPGIGTYSARVMIYRGYYSGAWFGPNYGGIMSGEIRPHKEEKAAQPEQKNTDGAFMPNAGRFPAFAALTPRGIEIVENGRSRIVPDTRGLVDFDWSQNGNGFIIARGGDLLRIDTNGRETGVISRGYSKIWSIDAADRSDRVVFAADVGSATGVVWQVGHGQMSPKRAGGGNSPVLDRTGNRLFYLPPASSNARRINVLDFNGRNRTGLPLATDNDANPGRHIAYADRRGAIVWSDNGTLRTLDDQSGSTVNQLTSGSHHDDRPTISPDNEYAAFIRYDRSPNGTLTNPRAIAIDLTSRIERPLAQGRCEIIRFRP